MNITNSNLNFNGGFRFRNMPLEAKNKLPDLSKKGKQIFYDFENKDDVFLVVKDEINYKVANFIKENKLEFEFYPQINTKCGLDSEKPEGLQSLLNKLSPKPLTTKTQLAKNITKQKLLNRVSVNSPIYVPNILKGLLIDTGLNINLIKGVAILDNKEFERKIYISRPLKSERYLVLIEPYSSAKPSERLLVDKNGKILKKYSSPDEIHKFYSDFKKVSL